jgi:IclR family acetate operon transcriptional repressor
MVAVFERVDERSLKARDLVPTVSEALGGGVVVQQSRGTIDALSRGIDLLELISRKGSVKLAELPSLLGSSRATAFRVLRTLQERGYVEHVRSEHRYRLGPGAAVLGARSRASLIMRMAEPAMAELRDISGETVNLALFQGGRLVYVEILEGVHAMRMSGSVGEEVPLHSTALGKATLTALQSEVAKSMLGSEPYHAYTPNTHTTWESLSRELETTEARGYSVDSEEMDVGAMCVGAVILDRHSYPVGGLSVSGLAARFPSAERERIGKRVLWWCQRIGEDMRTQSEESLASVHDHR